MTVMLSSRRTGRTFGMRMAILTTRHLTDICGVAIELGCFPRATLWPHELILRPLEFENHFECQVVNGVDDKPPQFSKPK